MGFEGNTPKKAYVKIVIFAPYIYHNMWKAIAYASSLQQYIITELSMQLSSLI